MARVTVNAASRHRRVNFWRRLHKMIRKNNQGSNFALTRAMFDWSRKVPVSSAGQEMAFSQNDGFCKKKFCCEALTNRRSLACIWRSWASFLASLRRSLSMSFCTGVTRATISCHTQCHVWGWFQVLQYWQRFFWWHRYRGTALCSAQASIWNIWTSPPSKMLIWLPTQRMDSMCLVKNVSHYWRANDCMVSLSEGKSQSYPVSNFTDSSA